MYACVGFLAMRTSVALTERAHEALRLFQSITGRTFSDIVKELLLAEINDNTSPRNWMDGSPLLPDLPAGQVTESRRRYQDRTQRHICAARMLGRAEVTM